jgi:hypothetical protein
MANREIPDPVPVPDPDDYEELEKTLIVLGQSGSGEETTAQENNQ